MNPTTFLWNLVTLESIRHRRAKNHEKTTKKRTNHNWYGLSQPTPKNAWFHSRSKLEQQRDASKDDVRILILGVFLLPNTTYRHKVRNTGRTIARLDSILPNDNPSTMDIDPTTITTGGITSIPPLLLGFLIPGGPLRTDFQPAAADATKWTLTLSCPGDIPSPIAMVSEVVCCVLSPLPVTHGILLYWQITCATQQTGFTLLGSLTPDQPSGVFRTHWSDLELPPPLTVTLGVSMEPRDQIQNMVNPRDQWESRLFVAQKIANDLFHYMQSFDTSQQPGHLVVPHTIFERWMARFESRFRRDPNFFMKTQE